MVSPENVHTSNIIRTKQVLFMYLRVCVCVCVTTFKVKMVYEYEREQGEVHGRIWKEERKGEMK